VNEIVYNQAGIERTMYSAPSPYDNEPTKPIDVQALRAWSAHRGDIPSATREAAYYMRRRARPAA
jgi:hypothetical protein